MGCAHSRVEKEETVWRCSERKRLMKQLLSCRSDLAAAHMAYLQSLRNTGATLRQFAEAVSDVPGNSHPHFVAPPSLPPPPPPPLPPSPPPPHFSMRKKVTEVGRRSNNDGNDSLIGTDTDDDDDESCILPPPPIHSSTWNFWDPFGIPSASNYSFPVTLKKDDGMNMQAVVDEDNWAETITEFGDEDDDVKEEKREHEDCGVDTSLKEKPLARELTDDISSTVSRITKETDTAAVVWRSKKTLSGIVKDIDDYFLKAASGGSDLLVFLESTHGHCLESKFNKTKGRTSKSAKVLSWSWSLKSFPPNRGVNGQSCESCGPGKHRITLEKIYEEEDKLYKEVKDNELAKVQLKKMISLLEKLETIENDYTRSEKQRSDIEILQTQILSLQESINDTCLSISKSRDEELHPQLLELILGLSRMWRTMYECHQVQNHISQQGNLLDNLSGSEPTTDSHRFATVQLENEVAFWHSSFCNLLNSLREYSHVLNQWVRLTDCLPYTSNFSSSIKKIHSICDEWKLALDRLPDKVTADSIQSLVSVIHSIGLQQNVELSQQKKLKRLENRFEKELNSVKPAQNAGPDDQPSLSNVKLDALNKRMEEEKAKYLTSIRVSRAMTLNNLHTSLSNVFQALMEFSNVCLQVSDSLDIPAEAPTGISQEDQRA